MIASEDDSTYDRSVPLVGGSSGGADSSFKGGSGNRQSSVNKTDRDDYESLDISRHNTLAYTTSLNDNPKLPKRSFSTGFFGSHLFSPKRNSLPLYDADSDTDNNDKALSSKRQRGDSFLL